METAHTTYGQRDYDVLIVPCGMETVPNKILSGLRFGINCTLRNGNEITKIKNDLEGDVLIVPCGMETNVYVRRSVDGKWY